MAKGYIIINFFEVGERTDLLLGQLLEVWEKSVKATHLFILPEERGNGLGKNLLNYGIQNYAVKEVTVNEQNPQAVGFYEHLGFKTYKRTD